MRFAFILALLAVVMLCDFTTARTLRVRRQNQNQNQLRDCIRRCPTTPQYNPVCGTDSVTYDNEGKLKCARNCGAGDVQVSFFGTCSAL